MNIPNKPKFGFVHWLDAHSLGSTDLVVADDLRELHGSVPILTAGWILRDDEIGVSLCSEYCGGMDYRNSTFVPRAMVVSVRYVRIPAARKQKELRDGIADTSIV